MYGARVTSRWIAYADESMRQRRDGSGLYVLAAALVEEKAVSEVRAAAARLAIGGAGRRVHWRNESPARRRKVVAAVADLDPIHLVIVGVGLDNPRQERARRLCLQRLLWELQTVDVHQVWLEARTSSLNHKDIALVDLLRVQGVLGPDLRVEHVRPTGMLGEPLLWLADIVAGAVSAARGDGELQYLAPLEPLLIEHIVSLA